MQLVYGSLADKMHCGSSVAHTSGCPKWSVVPTSVVSRCLRVHPQRTASAQCSTVAKAVAAPSAPETELAVAHAADLGVEPSTSAASRSNVVFSAFSGTASMAGQMVRGALRFLEVNPDARKAEEAKAAGDLLLNVAKSAEQAGTKKPQKAIKRVPADIRSYLKPTGIMETRYIRMLSNLCAQTYCIPRLTPRHLFRRHRMQLVTTSRACQLVLEPPALAGIESLDSTDGGPEYEDGMAASPTVVEQACKDLEAKRETQGALQVVEHKAERAVVEDPRMKGMPQPAEIVAARLSAIAAPLANNITSFTSAAASAVPIQPVVGSLQSAAQAGRSTAATTLSTMVLAVQASWGPLRDGAKARDAARKASSTKDVIDTESPTEWYVADDPVSHTRYFVIQGSDKLDHWVLNLMFDPVVFEDPSLGAKVHRGVYEAAKVMYRLFQPMVEEHLRSSPLAKVVFTGHSLGGSLATLLALMYLRRGVLPAEAISPIYTFGAPAIFCEGCCAGSCTPDSPCADCATGDHDETDHHSLLARLGLPEGAIRNVFMHRDIVPRAFACDYSTVSEWLRRFESFKDHRCLAKDARRQVMYYFIGKNMVLQPDAAQTFVQREGYHPMLPVGPGLYTLCEPSLLATVAAQARSAGSEVASNIAAITRKDPRDPIKPSASTAGNALGPPAASLRDAVLEIMDWPHPLDTLGDPASYGDDGAISRYHNPENYTRALGGVLHARTQPWRSLLLAAEGGQPTVSVSATPATAGVSGDPQPAAEEAGTALPAAAAEQRAAAVEQRMLRHAARPLPTPTPLFDASNSIWRRREQHSHRSATASVLTC